MFLIPLSLLFHLSDPDVSSEKPVLAPVATFSIVGYDAEIGALGIAVQSKFFAVGSVVPWAEVGVGAIATQSWANTTFGPNGLKFLKSGLSAEQTLERLVAEDSGRATRQVGIVDAKGNVANYTGKECNEWAGAVSGKHYTAQGNILAGEGQRGPGLAVHVVAVGGQGLETLVGGQVVEDLSRQVPYGLLLLAQLEVHQSCPIRPVSSRESAIIAERREESRMGPSSVLRRGPAECTASGRLGGSRGRTARSGRAASRWCRRRRSR